MLYFESETVLRFNNLEARPYFRGGILCLPYYFFYVYLSLSMLVCGLIRFMIGSPVIVAFSECFVIYWSQG